VNPLERGVCETARGLLSGSVSNSWAVRCLLRTRVQFGRVLERKNVEVYLSKSPRSFLQGLSSNEYVTFVDYSMSKFHGILSFFPLS
jgi:hypothetical protein